VPVSVVVPVAWGTVNWVLAAAGCWAGMVYVALALLTADTRPDAAAESAAVVRATSERLGRLALDVRGALGVTRHVGAPAETAEPARA
jgi:hypothetical protein